ncbi:MAG TPA: methylmalonyl-CoA mutase family protein, partial [Polyangiales bacterium]|nr:methylmalonyl-CoA mutase family protein [Polyangiales bacterium]
MRERSALIEAAVGIPVRIVTAASLFDGHDAAIHIVRRILQSLGAEVIHLGHDRSVDEIVQAAIQEDAQAIAISSYQGGHMEFFRYLVDQLRARGAGDVRVFGGGGGTISERERIELERYGVARIFGPEAGRALGLQGMVAQLLEGLHPSHSLPPSAAMDELSTDDDRTVAQLISWFETRTSRDDAEATALRTQLQQRTAASATRVVGITGTGGAGKSSVVDELLLRLRRDAPALPIGLLLVDPTRRNKGGALLGDRIRLNALGPRNLYARSLATRRAHLALSDSVGDAVLVLKAAGFGLVIVETAGIGQSDSEIVDLADLSIYVMTPDYGAPSQLEKIDMIELADLIVLNKSDRRGAADALRDVRKQWRRNHAAFTLAEAAIPVFATVASRFNDRGIEQLHRALRARLDWPSIPAADGGGGANEAPLIPDARTGYLAEVARTVRGYRSRIDEQAAIAADAGALARVLAQLGDAQPTLMAAESFPDSAADAITNELRKKYTETTAKLEPALREQLAGWPTRRAEYRSPTQHYQVREQRIEAENYGETLAGTAIPRVSFPTSEDWAEQLRFLALSNLPGSFPFTAGVFPFRQQNELPTRMFAGEGGPERTNRRFHLLARGQPSVRLSTAFDSVTLYGRDPDERPDIYGKVGNSGVSVCTLDDAKKLYSGFDLANPQTSVSLTINGPAPILLALFFNAAIDQAVERHLRAIGRLDASASADAAYRGPLPEGHDGLGLALLGRSGDELVDRETYARIKRDVLQKIRGTVQADILKEDQAQNTCIFSTEFALRLMGDVQSYFVEQRIQNFYSVSVSGYHIAEAGAHPITQLAFTLANAFTYVEYYLARGMTIDQFAPNFSFFFSLGLDAEYNVLGRVARRIWAIAMRERYGASARSQKLKYHIQTSGRSLHAQEMAWNDVRTTLQALSALSDNCNSLHTNAFDEAVTTPTAESVRSAVAIQLIIQRELGLSLNENPLSGSYFIEALTDAVEARVLEEFDRLSARGGVLGSMETLYQRGRIQEESLEYETRKHDGTLPIIGVNTFLSEQVRSSVEE